MNEFDDLTDLDDVFGPLRGAARSAELSQECKMVDLMVKTHRTSEGKPMFTSRRARIATLVATGVLGFGGMAAASPSLGRDKPAEEPAVEAPVEESVIEEPVVEEPAVEEPVVEVPVVEVPVIEEVVVPEQAEEPVVEEPAAVPLVDDPDTDFDETTCLPGNHGKTVSAVARGEFPAGVLVRDAAHSTCGKNEVDEPEVDDEVDTETEVDDEVESDDEVEADESEPKAERPSRSDKAAEKSNNGNGNGNGKGKQGD